MLKRSLLLMFVPFMLVGQGWVMPDVEINRTGWTALAWNPSELAYSTGSYGIMLTTNIPLISVTTNTGIIGYDGDYTLRHRSNSESKVLLNYKTGFDVPFFDGKLGFGLFRPFGRLINLDLYEFPVGYYDTVLQVSMPQFDWGTNISSIEFAVGWATHLTDFLTVGLSGGYVKVNGSYKYVKLHHISSFIDNFMADSVPIQFVYIPEMREFNGDGTSWTYALGIGLEVGKIKLSLGMKRYQPISLEGYELRTTYFPQDSILAETIDSAVFSGGVSEYSLSTALNLFGFTKFSAGVTLKLAENADLNLKVERFRWDRPTWNTTGWPRGISPAVFVQRDTFYLDWNDITRYSLELRYETIHNSVLFFGLGYTEPIQNEHYTPLFGEPGAAFSLKFAIDYMVSQDLAVEVGYEFLRHNRTAVGEVGSADAQFTLSGEYAASSDKVLFGLIYNFPNKKE